jgi:hypothetical protein
MNRKRTDREEPAMDVAPVQRGRYADYVKNPKGSDESFGVQEDNYDKGRAYYDASHRDASFFCRFM